MRVCLLVKQFPVVSQTFVVDHAAGLLERGHEVVVVTLAFGRPSADFKSPEWARVVQRTAPAPHTPTGNKPERRLQFGGMILRSAVRDRSRPLRFALHDTGLPPEGRGPRLLCATRLERAQPFDVLHAHFGPAAIAAISMREAGLFHAPVICSFHGFDVHIVPAHNPGCYDGLPEQLAGVTAGTEYMRGALANLGFAAADTTLWPQGVDTTRFSPRADRPASEDQFRVLSVARLVDFKGVDVALRAIALARPFVRGLRYTVIGDGERRAFLENLADELGIADITTFAGALAHDRVLAAFHDADVFVLTGRTDADGHKEGQGVAPLEASACGLPVVASRSGGLTEVVLDGETGLVVEPEDAAGVSTALVRLADDAALRDRLGAAGRQHVIRRFSREASLDTIEDLYRDCV